jgi:RimJ/RimL family protein N-acetyltransferase
MITLQDVVDGNPFTAHPQLRTIWPAHFTEIAEDAAQDAIAHMPFGDVGGLYLVKLGNRVIGITGFFYCESETEPFLRWHGIIPAERRKGYSREAMRQVAARIKGKLPDARGLTELVPQNEDGPAIAAHFEQLGFVKSGPAEMYDWSTHPWQPVRLDLESSATMALLNQKIEHETT